MAIDAVIESSVQLDDSEYRKKLGELPKETKMSMSKVALAFAGVTAAVAGVVKGVSALTGAYSKEQDSIVGLQTALRIQGEEYNLNEKRLSAFAGELQNVTKFGDEVTRSAMALGLNMGLSVGNIEDATRAAMGLAEAYRMDLNSAMQLVARAANGNTGRLSMYGIQVDNTKSKQEQFAQVLAQGGKLFNVATANAQTFGGKMAQLGNIWGDLKERLGELLVGIFDLGDGSDWLTETLGDMTNWLTENMDMIIYWKDVAIGSFKAAQDVLAQIFGWVSVAFPTVIDNVGKIFSNLPEFAKAYCLDIYNAFVALARAVTELFGNLWDAVVKMIKEGSFEGFSSVIGSAGKVWEEYSNPSYSNMKDVAKRVGIKALPELKLDLSQYDVAVEKAGDRLAERLDRKTRERRDESYKGNGGGETASGPESVTKNAVAGSFSAELLGMMLGYNSPQRETARNTKKTVDMLDKIYDRQAEGEVYA